MKNYELLKEKYIEEVASNVKLLKHTKSGAHILLFENEDPNKVFSVGFRTPPTNDTGVPHILEHSTLCGSKKFPVKDPFIELLKSSLNTFLNAMTYPDKTVYPVASLNDHDFKNLMEVYMDAVFYPNVYLHEEIFKQEGWHYELDSVDGDIIYNGVVYNEMKGAFSSPEQVVMRVSRHALFPDTTYGVESGGDPEFIPDLTYQEFLKFHQRFYHPSNSYIFLYGNMNMDEKLEWMDKEYLSHFDRIPQDSDIEYQKSFKEPHYEQYFYPVGKEESLENKTYYSYNAVVGTYKDVTLTYAFQVLTYALFKAPGAPLKQALVASGIGNDILSDFDSGMKQSVLSVIVKDAPENKLEELKSIINNTLNDLVTKGIDKKSLLSAINYYEFKYREADFGGIPAGLVYGLNAMDTWLYDENDPFSTLEFYHIFDELKEKVESNYYEELLKKHLIDNPHIAYVTVSPSNTLGEEKAKALKDKLQAYKDTLTKEQLEKLVEDTKNLKIYQETPSTEEELATIPLLTKDDIDEKVDNVENIEEIIDDVKVIKQDIDTKGISYFTLNFDTKNVPLNLIPYIGLLNKILTNVDTANYLYEDLTKEININTGGITTSFTAYSVGKNDVLPLFTINAKALDANVNYIFTLTKEIITSSKLDNKQRIREIIMEAKSQSQMFFMESGHAAAVNRALSYLRSANLYNEYVSGVAQYQFIESLVKDFDNLYPTIVKNLEELMKYVFRKENLIISYTGKNFKYEEEIMNFLPSLRNDKIKKEPFAFKEDTKNEGFKTPSTVQYVARVGNYEDLATYTGAFQVFAMALRYDYLWMKVRVLGGAYGCMANFQRNGNVLFVSYRDPNLDRTNEVYEGIPAYIDNFNPTNEELTKYIIGAIGYLDTPRTPREQGQRAFTNYLQGITYEDLVRERKEVINVTLENIKALKPLIEKALKDDAMCTIGNENKVEESPLFKEKKYLMNI